MTTTPPTCAPPRPERDACVDIDLVRAAVWGPPTGPRRSDYDLAPALRAHPQDERALKPAAVLCALAPRPDGWRVVLTRRAAHLKRHAGQIAFPGGKIDAEDGSPLAAALREAEEEIGLVRQQVTVLGAIERYETRTGFLVTPFIGLVDPAFQPLADPSEVSEVFEAPLDHVVNPANIEVHWREAHGVRRPFYAIPWENRYIWGATAAMLKALADRIEAVRAAAAAREPS